LLEQEKVQEQLEQENGYGLPERVYPPSDQRPGVNTPADLTTPELLPFLKNDPYDLTPRVAGSDIQKAIDEGRGRIIESPYGGLPVAAVQDENGKWSLYRNTGLGYRLEKTAPATVEPEISADALIFSQEKPIISTILIPYLLGPSLQAGTSVTPGVSTGVDLYEATTGRDAITGDKITGWRYGLTVFAAAVPIVTARWLRLLGDVPANKVDEVLDGTSSVKNFDVVDYRPSNPPFENHHGVLDVWAKHNIDSYVSRSTPTPTVALTKVQHEATKRVYRDWLLEQTGKRIGGRVDWSKVSPQEMQRLTERMFDAAGVPEAARKAYYRAFHQYIYRGN
jgi:hypothetical protein